MIAATNHHPSIYLNPMSVHNLTNVHTLHDQQLVGYLIEHNNRQMDSLKDAISRNIVEVRWNLFQ